MAALLSRLLFLVLSLLISAINGRQFGPNCWYAAPGIWRGSPINRFNYASWGIHDRTQAGRSSKRPGLAGGAVIHNRGFSGLA